MGHLKYREKVLEFRSWISKEDVMSAEQILIDNGIDKDEADIVLQAIGYALLDLEIYEEEDNEDDGINNFED